jgi:hypothetical protein
LPSENLFDERIHVRKLRSVLQGWEAISADDRVDLSLSSGLSVEMKRHGQEEDVDSRNGLNMLINDERKRWYSRRTVSAPPEYREAAAHLMVSSSSAESFLFSRCSDVKFGTLVPFACTCVSTTTTSPSACIAHNSQLDEVVGDIGHALQRVAPRSCFALKSGARHPGRYMAYCKCMMSPVYTVSGNEHTRVDDIHQECAGLRRSGELVGGGVDALDYRVIVFLRLVPVRDVEDDGACRSMNMS